MPAVAVVSPTARTCSPLAEPSEARKTKKVRKSRWRQGHQPMDERRARKRRADHLLIGQGVDDVVKAFSRLRAIEASAIGIAGFVERATATAQ